MKVKNGHGADRTPLFPLERLSTRLAQVLIDVIICACSVVMAYTLRFDAGIPDAFYHQMLVLVPVLAGARAVVHIVSGVYRVVWRYVGVREAFLFVRTVGILSVVLLGLRLVLPSHIMSLKVPISIIVLEGFFTFMGMSSARLLRRILHERTKRRAAQAKDTRRAATLLVGAGSQGLAIAKEALRSPRLGIDPIGFVDDDKTKAGMDLHGLRVLGTIDEAEAIISESGATTVIITTDAIPAKVLLSLMDRCRKLEVKVRIVPGLYEILDGDTSAGTLREVRIEDILSRDPVGPSMSLEDLTSEYQGKSILVTGAGGSIGGELCRQLAVMRPAKLLVLERDENNLFHANRELRTRLHDACVPLLADVTDTRQLERIFREYRPDVVFHAAAFKHVPVMERFPAAAISNNVFGTMNLAKLADSHGVGSFVMISTDKAVNPSSVMGASKRFAEIVVQNIAPNSKTRFSCVRFGNVLGSRGSVVPIFAEQIRTGGPVTVTHPEAMRYFMTIPEAANLVLQAATQGESGEIFVLDMGTPVKIIDLARQMIHLSGFTEDQVPIQIVGCRPGEKLFEELNATDESIEPTSLRKILRVKPTAYDEALINALLERLNFLVRADDARGVREALRDLGIGYTGRATGEHRSVTDPAM